MFVKENPDKKKKKKIKIGNGDFGPMAMFWQSYLVMVQILLDFVKSIRLPDWNLHLQSTERMLM